MSGIYKITNLIDDSGEIIKTYNTIVEASKDLNIEASGIGRVCKGEKSSIKGCKFKRAN